MLGTAVLRAARVGHRAGTRRLGATLYELGHGAAASPLHIHHANQNILTFTGDPHDEPGPDNVHAFRLLDGVHPMEGEPRAPLP